MKCYIQMTLFAKNFQNFLRMQSELVVYNIRISAYDIIISNCYG